MKISYYPVFLFILFISLNSFSQMNDTEKKKNITLLFGQWEAFKKTDLDGGDGSDITFNGLPYTVRLELIFLDRVYSYFNNGEGRIETSYTLKQDTLKISRFTYSIVEITDSELVLKEEEFLGKLIYLKKIEDNSTTKN
ncbi:hypothetical protein [Flagellimonas hadalis]|uniref:Lipocalin-like domain-containing protein n=1 Tax=Flagellimonas hadalis TaxID=2597517 RepID=A0A5N5IQN4_9FLAO|nr:hypothetical protein [Allomuricauda hadalis]KAB5490142.1 hypothetical protein FOT42_007280 [Allomuricauda hadalis]